VHRIGIGYVPRGCRFGTGSESLAGQETRWPHSITLFISKTPSTFVVRARGGMPMASSPRIGILGGGFAGLYTIFSLRRLFPRSLDITLFDKKHHFLNTPVLHETATGTVNARHVVIPIRKVVEPREVHIRREEVTRVDLDRRVVESPSGAFKFDHLVLAPGSEANFRKQSMLPRMSYFILRKKDPPFSVPLQGRYGIFGLNVRRG
jgi:glycine/D-amino acid oxidase-like deaminating enzyme